MATTTLRPVGEGDVIQWTPSSGSDNALMVDEAVADDLTTYVSLAGFQAGQQDCYTHSGGVPTGATSISLTVYGRLATLNAGYFAQIQLGLRIGGVTYLASAENINATAAWVNFNATFAVNPATAAAWTPTDVNNAQLVVYDTTSTNDLYCTQVYAIATYAELVEVALAGSLPAMAGALAVKFIKAIVGILPGMSGNVENDAPTHVAGALPAMSGEIAVSADAFASPRGRLPAMSGAIGIAADIALAGSLPAMSGVVHLNSSLALAGSLPAMNGRIEDFAITTTDKSHSLAIALIPRRKVRRLGGRTEVRKL